VSNPHAAAELSFRAIRPSDAAAEFAKFNSTPAVHARALESHGHFNELRGVNTSIIPQNGHHAGYPGSKPALAPNVSGGPIPGPGLQSDARAQNWALEFEKLSISPQNDHENTLSQFWGLPYGVPAFGSAGPAAAPPMFAHRNGETLSYPELSNQKSNAADFEAIFTDIENNLHNAETEAPQNTNVNHEKMGERDDGANLIAEQIMQQVSDRSSPHLMEKMKGSQFMTVLSKIRTNEVKLDSAQNMLVNENGSVDAYDVLADSSHDWPPQWQRSATASEQPPLSRGESQRQSAAQPSQSDNGALRGNTAYENGIMGLDDPDTYLHKLRNNLDHRLFQKSPYTSSFKAAQELGPVPVSTEDWEEHYEEWV